MLAWAQERHDESLALLETGFLLSPEATDSGDRYYAAVAALGLFSRAEEVLRETQALLPGNRRVAFLLIDSLIRQEKFGQAMDAIERAMLDFGIDDGMLAAALDIRAKVGEPRPEGTGKKPTVSLSMIVKNEERNLAQCLASAKPVVDEMIVVDTGSRDRTRGIAAAFGAKVFEFAWTDDFSAARNHALAQATCDWVLVLDADEALSSRDYAALRDLTKRKTGAPIAYSFDTRNYSNQVHMHGWTPNDGLYPREEAGAGWYPSRKTRLFPNDRRIRFENPVHEFVEGSLERAGIAVKFSPIPIHHYGRFDVKKVEAKGEQYYLLGKKKLEEGGITPKALYELAVQAGELGRFEEAVELWQRLLAQTPNDPLAHFNLGYALLKLGRYEESLSASRTAGKLDPGLKENILNYANAELAVGDVGNAVQALEELLTRVPEYPPAQGLLAAALALRGGKDRALSILADLKKRGFDCAEFLKDTAAMLASADRADLAESLIETADASGFGRPEMRAILEECGRKCGEHIAVGAQA